MKGKIKYTDKPLGQLSVIEDFLPPPEELVLRRDLPSSKQRVHQTIDTLSSSNHAENKG